MLLWLGWSVTYVISSAPASRVFVYFEFWHAASHRQSYNKFQLSLFVYGPPECHVTRGTLDADELDEILGNIQPLHANLESNNRFC